jgi:hypothetical protein
MRSIRVGGRTLARVVVHSFLESKSKREVELEEEEEVARVRARFPRQLLAQK